MHNRLLKDDAIYLIKSSEFQNLSRCWSSNTNDLIREKVGEWMRVTCTMFEGSRTTLMITPGSEASCIIEAWEPQLKKISDNEYLGNYCLSFHNDHINALIEAGHLKPTAEV